MNWAWGETEFGEPKWVDLSDAVGNWTEASGIDPLPDLAWTAPTDASMGSFPAQFAAAALALGTNVARPSTALMSDADFTDECELGWPERTDLNLSDAHLLSSCLVTDSSVRSQEEAKASSTGKSVSELVRLSNINKCEDLLGSDWDVLEEVVYIAKLASALPATGSCADGCPVSRPLCKDTNGTMGCARPTCDDVEPLCHDNSGAGALARFMCGVTCGCRNLTSELLWIGPNSGSSGDAVSTARAD